MAASHCRTEVVFDYSWKQVVQAFWNRYPNPSSSHVLTEDTIAREIRDGKLYSRRILSKTNHVPKWGERFYKNTPVKIIEDSVLDPKKKTLVTFTRNIGFKKIMRVDEIVEYSEQKDGRTLAIRRAYVSSQVFGFSRAIRAFGIERFKSNCHKTANGFNYVLMRMFPNHKISPKHQQQQQQQNQQNGAVVQMLESNSIDQQQSNASSNNGTVVVHQSQHQSRMERLKKGCKHSYYYFKAQAIKVAQLFSVKN